MTTIDVLRFRPSSAVDHDRLVALDARFQQEVAYQAPGLLRRTSAVADDGEWLVVTVWTDLDSAEAGPGFDESELGRELSALIGDVSIRRYGSLD